MSMCFLIRTEYYLRLKLTALEVSKSLIKASIPVFYFKIGFTNFNNNLPFSFNHVKYIFYKLLLVINDLIEQFDPKIFSHCKARLSKRMNIFLLFPIAPSLPTVRTQHCVQCKRIQQQNGGPTSRRGKRSGASSSQQRNKKIKFLLFSHK